MEKNKILQIEKLFINKKVAVIGDMMLDGYFWGNVSRVSPEAPVPVVDIDSEFFRFGGAANVALNILKLGGTPLPIGVIGDDTDGNIFKSLLNEVNISNEALLIDKDRPTTTKTRVIAGNQHVVRIDKEKKNFLSKDLESKILNNLVNQIDSIDAVILQDYNKGVLTERIIKETIKLCKTKNKIITVDPKFINFKQYKNATVFKPNKKETENILGMRIENESDISKAGQELIDLLNPEYVLLTLGEKGIALFDRDYNEFKIPTKARKVADVSGAGDTVISTLTYCLACGLNIKDAAYIANYAGGLVCEEVGIVPIDKVTLFKTLKSS